MPTLQDYFSDCDTLIAEHSLLVDKIEKSIASDRKTAEASLRESFKFLYLIGKHNQKLTPSLLVDLAWHEFILFTRSYHRFCEKHFGRYIHHQPGGDEKENANKFQQTLRLYALSFGTPPQDIWGYTQKEEFELDCGAEL